QIVQVQVVAVAHVLRKIQLGLFLLNNGLAVGFAVKFAHVFIGSISGRQAAQDGPHRTGVGVGERQGKGDQFVVACGDLIQDQVLEYAQFMLQYGLVAVQRFAVCRIDAGCIQPNEQDAALGQELDGLGGKGGEVVAPGGDPGL